MLNVIIIDQEEILILHTYKISEKASLRDRKTERKILNVTGKNWG